LVHWGNMITQKFNQGDSEIIIETAESLEDAKKHGFKQDNFTRYFINGKSVESYMHIMSFIIEETQKNKQQFSYDQKSLVEKRNEMIAKQKETIRESFDHMRENLIKQGVPESVISHFNKVVDESPLESFDKIIKKINLSGARVIE